MIFMVLPLWLLMMIPQLVGGAASAALSQGAVNRQNRYNSPFEQFKRANRIGVPLAALNNLSSSSQSSMPDYSGLTNAIGSFKDTYIASEQMKLLKEQINKTHHEGFKAEQDANIANNLSQISDEETQALMNGGSLYDGEYRTRAYISKRLEYEGKKLGYDMVKNQKEISDIDTRIRQATEKTQIDKAKADLDALLLKIKIGEQDFENTRVRTAAVNDIFHRMEKGGLNLFESMFIVLMGRLSGGASTTGMNLGF